MVPIPNVQGDGPTLAVVMRGQGRGYYDRSRSVQKKSKTRRPRISRREKEERALLNKFDEQI